MIYAQIKDGILVNTIFVDDTSDLEALLSGYDELVRIDTEEVIPAIGWKKEGEVIVKPSPDPAVYDPDAGPITN